MGYLEAEVEKLENNMQGEEKLKEGDNQKVTKSEQQGGKMILTAAFWIDLRSVI